nr:MAG TPA: hypothetical protein [Caudoviricetes sp.]
MRPRTPMRTTARSYTIYERSEPLPMEEHNIRCQRVS